MARAAPAIIPEKDKGRVLSLAACNHILSEFVSNDMRNVCGFKPLEGIFPLRLF
jgi:hypothetical protein